MDTNAGKISIPVFKEVPVVAKEARVVEEIVIIKGVAERTETVQDTMRRTDVEDETLIGEGMKNKSNTA